MSEPQRIKCPNCGIGYPWRDAIANRKVLCPCGTKFRMPANAMGRATRIEAAPPLPSGRTPSKPAPPPAPAKPDPQAPTVAEPLGLSDDDSLKIPDDVGVLDLATVAEEIAPPPPEEPPESPLESIEEPIDADAIEEIPLLTADDEAPAKPAAKTPTPSKPAARPAARPAPVEEDTASLLSDALATPTQPDAYDLTEAAPATHAHRSPYGGGATPVYQEPPDDGTGPDCPSCGKKLRSNALICAACGINIKSGRPIATARSGDENQFYTNAESALRVVSILMFTGIFPISSQAGGRSKPYATWSIAGVTIFISIAFWLAGYFSPHFMQSGKYLMIWSGGKTPSSGLLHALYTTTDWGDKAAFNHQLARLQGKVPPMNLTLAAHYALSPEKRAIGEFRWYQPITNAFLHADRNHLAGNILFLIVFGSRVNALIGNLGTLLLYPILAVLASLSHMISMYESMPTAGLGASGAIMGLAGIYFIFFPIHRVIMAAWIRIILFWRFAIWKARGFWVLLFYLSSDITATLFGQEDGVAHWAHLGGFIFGMAVATGLLLSRGVNAHADLFDLVLGKWGWPLFGKPSQWTDIPGQIGWLQRLALPARPPKGNTAEKKPESRLKAAPPPE